MSGEHRDFMLKWNMKYPLDRWFREKYKIPFMSKQHRESYFLDIRREWEEDQLFNEIGREKGVPYKPNTGDFLKHREKPKEELFKNAKAAFDKILKETNGSASESSDKRRG